MYFLAKIEAYRTVLQSLLKDITDGGLRMGPPAAGGFGGLRAKPPAVGRFFVIFRKKKAFLMPLNRISQVFRAI